MPQTRYHGFAQMFSASNKIGSVTVVSKEHGTWKSSMSCSKNVFLFLNTEDHYSGCDRSMHTWLAPVRNEGIGGIGGKTHVFLFPYLLRSSTDA